MKTLFNFSIANINISLNNVIDCKLTEGFYPFLSTEEIGYKVEFKKVNTLPSIPQKIIYQSRSFAVTKEFGEFKRYFYDGLNNNHLYAIGTYDWLNKKVLIEYIPYGQPFLNETLNSFFHISFEKMLMNENRMILHSSCVNTEFGGILFSGISGIGKSTQAKLWCDYENADLINGDRTILFKDENDWLGFGSPYAGSSKCYKNEKCTIKAIVFPKKEKYCSVNKLSKFDAFRKIYSCMTINTWDEKFVSSACDFVTKLVNEIPVYEMPCTPTKESVDCLKKRLLEDLEHE